MYSLALILCSLLQSGDPFAFPNAMPNAAGPNTTGFNAAEQTIPGQHSSDANRPASSTEGRLPLPSTTRPTTTRPSTVRPSTERQPASRQPHHDLLADPQSFDQPTLQDATRDRLFFRNGVLELPEHSLVTLAAPERAVLMSLATEVRDSNGNPILDADGKPMIVPARRGMRVQKGQVLGYFDNRELHSTLRINNAQLEVSKAERDKTIEVQHAARGVQVAMSEFQSMLEANSRHPGIHPRIEIEKAQLAVAQAEAQLELQRYTLEEIKTREVVVRESEMERTKTQIAVRELVAPLDGIIVEIYAAEGEWKREGDPVLAIMNLETMLVRVPVDANRYSDSDLDGKAANIQVRLANGRIEDFLGTVVFCDPTIKVDDLFDVYIEVQNRRIGNHWLLTPNRRGVDIVIPLQSVETTHR